MKLSVSLPDGLVAQVDELAVRRRRSRSATVALLLEQALAQAEQVGELVSLGVPAAPEAAPPPARARTGVCPHRVPAGVFCKRCG